MLNEASLASKIKKQQTNEFDTKSIFRIRVLIMKKFTHTLDLKTIANLISECQEDELPFHLLTAPKKASHTSQITYKCIL